MNKLQKNWLVIGVPKNWETALSQPIPLWGLKPRFQSEFQMMNTGDLLWFYATYPISGIIGIGMVKDKYIDNINLVWPEELEKKLVIWPLRFRIHVLKILPVDRWRTDRVSIADFNLFWRIGFQSLSDNYTTELIKRTSKLFGELNHQTLFAGATISQATSIHDKLATYGASETSIVSHREVQDRIAEIGKLQFYYTEIEYPIELPNEKKNLDVVWKREISGLPTFAFEVELSGMLEKAVARLKFAYNRWNSRPRIIVPKESVQKIHNIIASEDRNFVQQLKVYEPANILELLNKKRELKITEEHLGIY